MTAWTVYCFECANTGRRATLMDRFERDHPVSFPDDRYSVAAELAVDGRTVEADFAWVGRYLYVTTTEPADDIVYDATEGWERAAIGEFDATSGTAETVTLVLDSEAGGDDEMAGGSFRGLEGLGGMDVLYVLAMTHQFRFRSYSALPPARHRAPHPDAFTAVDAVETFVEDMAEVTDVEPTDEGVAFLRSDPADDDRYVFGETYGPADAEFAELSTSFEVDEAAALEDGELPSPGEVLSPEERPDPPDRDEGRLARLRRLLGL